MLAKFLNKPINEGETVLRFAMANGVRPVVKNALIGIVVAIPAIMLRVCLQRIVPGVAPFVTLFPAVVIAAVIGGRIAGGTAGLAGLVMADLRWLDPSVSLDILTKERVLNNGLFLVSVILVLWVTYSLRAERDRTAAYFEVAGNLLLVIGADGVLRQVNQQGIAALGYRSSAELVGKNWFDTCIPDRLRRQARLIFQEALADELLHERESAIIRPDGSERTIHWHFVALKRVDGGTSGLLASGVDITESRRTHEALARNEARLNAVLRQFPGAVTILERPHGKIVTRSDRTAEILGQPAAAFDTIERLASYGGLHDDGRPYRAGEYPIARALQSGEEVNGEMLRYRRGDNRVIDLEVYASPIRDDAGEILGAVGIALDVSNRMEAERKLRQSEERLRVALDAGTLGIWDADLVADTVHCDTRLAEMIGLPASPATLDRTDLSRHVHPSDRYRLAAAFRTAVRTGKMFACEFAGLTAGGDTRWFAASGVVVPPDRHMIGVLQDVTDRRRREDALREALGAREMLIREAEHRIKNSLQMVISMLAMQKKTIADPMAAEAIASSIARVGAIAEAHFALQQSDDLRQVDLGAMLKEVCTRLASLRKETALECIFAGDLTISADQAIPTALMVSELLTNSLRHAYPPEVPGKIVVTLKNLAGELTVTVTDDGLGIPEPSQRRTGLGSRLIGMFAQQVGGEMVVSSPPGGGTSVSITMPVAEIGDLIP
jgi:PAS domain S-box-containing protein